MAGVLLIFDVLAKSDGAKELLKTVPNPAIADCCKKVLLDYFSYFKDYSWIV